MANLRVVVSNNRPIREERHPRTWLLYKYKGMVEIHVTHDYPNGRFVLDKGGV